MKITINQNENQVILINGNGEIIGISDVLVNGVSVVSNNIAYIIVPTKTSELINNSGFLTSETDPTVPTYIKQISMSDINNWNNKQNALVSGTNIKTINNESLLGSGNIEINSGESYSAGTGINIENNIISNTITNYNDVNTNGYAGIPKRGISGLAAKASKGTLRYRVHTVNGKWLGWITDFNQANWATGVAGIKGRNIDGIQAELVGVPGYQVEYRVGTYQTKGYLNWIRGYGAGAMGYAGIYGQTIDRIQMRIVKV